jgi:hypothetical protein
VEIAQEPQPHKACYSPVYRVHNPRVPLQKPATLSIDAVALPERLRSRALLVSLNDKDARSSAGGEYADGMVSANIMSFGRYAISVDTMPPVIRPVNIHHGAHMNGKDDIRIRIGDNLSGIATYNGYIDDRWALFEYDAKRSMLHYTFDPARLQRNTRHKLRLEVTDAKGNQTVYTAEFWW